MKFNHAFLLGLVLTICILFIGGCKRPSFRSKQPPKPAPKEFCEEAQPMRLPFLGDIAQGASQSVLDNIKPLYRIGFLFLGASGVVGIFLGLKAGIGIALGGIAGVVSAVIVSEFPRVLLLFVILGVTVLAAMAFMYLKRLWDSHQSLGAITEATEELDTGPRSPGRMLKKKLVATGKDTIVRRGVDHFKKLFGWK